jgi:hypothetical protein
MCENLWIYTYIWREFLWDSTKIHAKKPKISSTVITNNHLKWKKIPNIRVFRKTPKIAVFKRFELVKKSTRHEYARASSLKQDRVKLNCIQNLNGHLCTTLRYPEIFRFLTVFRIFFENENKFQSKLEAEIKFSIKKARFKFWISEKMKNILFFVIFTHSRLKNIVIILNSK